MGASREARWEVVGMAEAEAVVELEAGVEAVVVAARSRQVVLVAAVGVEEPTAVQWGAMLAAAAGHIGR